MPVTRKWVKTTEAALQHKQSHAFLSRPVWGPIQSNTECRAWALWNLALTLGSSDTRLSQTAPQWINTRTSSMHSPGLTSTNLRLEKKPYDKVCDGWLKKAFSCPLRGMNSGSGPGGESQHRSGTLTFHSSVTGVVSVSHEMLEDVLRTSGLLFLHSHSLFQIFYLKTRIIVLDSGLKSLLLMLLY